MAPNPRGRSQNQRSYRTPACFVLSWLLSETQRRLKSHHPGIWSHRHQDQQELQGCAVLFLCWHGLEGILRWQLETLHLRPRELCLWALWPKWESSWWHFSGTKIVALSPGILLLSHGFRVISFCFYTSEPTTKGLSTKHMQHSPGYGRPTSSSDTNSDSSVIRAPHPLHPVSKISLDMSYPRKGQGEIACTNTFCAHPR